ncbi:MAG: molybdopterin-dependent oxidoreductase [Halothiobacillaceae bacterium]
MNVFKPGRRNLAARRFRQGRGGLAVGMEWVAGLLLAALISTTVRAEPLPSPTEPVILTLAGKIAKTNHDDQARFDLPMLAALGEQRLSTSTVVTDGVNAFVGVWLRDVLAAVGAEGDTVVATALNDYRIEIPVEDFFEYQVLLAWEMDGERLTPRDKGPLWIVYPRDDHVRLQDIRYDYRWVWQLERLDVK